MATEKQCKDFIAKIAPIVQELAPKYNVKFASPVIAQACLESSYGTSSKAKHHNYFGLKATDRKGRVDYESGYFKEGSKEQRKDGTWYPITCEWFEFKNMHDGIEGYFQFLFKHTTAYKSALSATTPEGYLRCLKNTGYATASDYPEINMKVIEKWNLTQYDKITTKKEVEKMKINIHAGHCPDGKGASGAVSLIKESTEARKVKNELIKLLKADGHTVYDCTCDLNKTQSGCLTHIVNKCNAHKVDLDISIHFNSGAGDKKGNGKTTGVEVFVYSSSSKAKDKATKVCKEIAKLGYKNRGVKYSTGLYVLKNTKSPAMLIECCFVDDKDDVALYNYKKMAKAIYNAII